MKLLLLLCGLATAACPAFSQKQKTTANRFAGMDTAFARALKDWKAAGFAVSVVEKNKVIYTQGFGYRDYEKKLPATANTQYAIGSCTKAFTASLLGLLKADDKLDYDKPVRTYLPELKFANNEMNSFVSLRDMMCHRTGLPRYDYSWYYFPPQSEESLIDRIQYMEPTAPLRQQWQYNNFMFMLQGAVVAKLTGKSWKQNMQEKLLTPLGMNNTSLEPADWMKATDLPVGYTLKHDSIIYQIDYYDDNLIMGPCGSMNSSVADMAKWLTLWINRGKFNGKEILPATYTSEAMSSQMVVAGNLPAANRPDMFMSNYGFGWSLSSYRGHYRVEHGGNIDGFSASTCFFPSDSIGIVVLCNQDGSSVPAVVRNLIADRLLGLPYRDWETTLYTPVAEGRKKAAEAAKTVVSDKVSGTHPSHPLQDYTGTYNHDKQEQFEVSRQHDSLYLITPATKFWLQHYHYDVFQLFTVDKKMGIDTAETDLIRAIFSTNGAGKIVEVSLPLEPAAKPIVFTRTAKPGTISKDSLQKYVGDYTISGIDIKFYLKGDDKLYMFVAGQPEYELVYEEKNKFALKNMQGFEVQFILNAKDEAIEALSIQPNGTFKATRKVKL